MNILVLNAGSSTLKFQVVEASAEPGAAGRGRRLGGGIVARIGGPASLSMSDPDGRVHEERASIPDHDAAARAVLDRLGSCGADGALRVDGVGHRIVHGGDLLAEPVLIDGGVLDTLEALAPLDPLHAWPALRVIRAARAALGPGVPMVATFDTAFHRTLPARAANYAIPRDLAQRHAIRRYGFHGLAHRSMMERYAALTATPLDRVRIITLQLGNGCSAAAIQAGRSIDTSMGMTPLEGLIMGTRSGDLDPALVAWLARRERVTADEVEEWLNNRSGLLGVSGRSSDMRDLVDAERQGDARAALAVEMFCYRVKKYIGAYLAAMGGADAVVFGGGIGEHAPPVRARICADMEWCGLALDTALNESAAAAERRISTPASTLHAYVIPVDEEAVIARDTVACLRGKPVV
jgi:acetate kinase